MMAGLQLSPLRPAKEKKLHGLVWVFLPQEKTLLDLEKLEPMRGGHVGLLLGQGGAKVAHLPVGNDPMHCMTEERALSGLESRAVVQTK
ncbi:hypothetical protein Taro_051383 [Colocasia esculenta]|uniref:Uncharacterized protein n=1 Tax=Colocasia esculenta TaxID=4460 RepID=A0A843XGL8_COLES|nr:hypothetical protein [Colocasia esculenta]